jgi:heterodisulfide reductase subunit A
MCSDPGQGLIVEDIGEYGLDKVVVSACSPRMHEPTFRTAIQGAGLNPYCLEIANIREQCSWVHPDKQNGTAKAKSLVASAVAKAALLEPLEAREVGVV